MSCIISSPSSDSGKTTLALLISCWAFSKGLKIQTFKVGPDYLDQQHLSSIGHPICRNLDIFLSGEDWVKTTFDKNAKKYDLSLIEGAMGLFDGLGSTQISSTAHVAKLLKLPLIFIVNAKGTVASLLPLVNGFRDFDQSISIAGIIFNNVNSERHKYLIKEVFKDHSIEILGFLPSNKRISLLKGNLGLISPLEFNKKIDINYFAFYAEKNLNLKKIKSLLSSRPKPTFVSNPQPNININIERPIAIAQDKVFHFQYPETKDFLLDLGIPILQWSISKDEEIPEDVEAVIIPGGFPEKYAEEVSSSGKSLKSLKNFLKKGFIYAECGGMMILGDYILDENEKMHKMAGVLPFTSQKGSLSLGYRYLKGHINSPLIKKNQILKGHEFHYWQQKLTDSKPNTFSNKSKSQYRSPWEIRSWESTYKKEGWANKNLHASWVHLHLPSSIEATRNLLENIQNNSKKKNTI